MRGIHNVGRKFAFLTLAGMFAVVVWRIRTHESSDSWTNEDGRARWGEPD